MSPDADDGVRRKLLAELDDRLDLFVDGDRNALMGGEATTLASALAAVAGSDLETAYSLGLFHHYRLIGAVPGSHDGDPAEDAVSALGYFGEVYRQAPDLIPDVVFEVVKAAWTPRVDDVEAWQLRASHLLRELRRFDLPELFSDGILLLKLALDTGLLESADRARCLSGLVIAHAGRFEAIGDPIDLNEAVDAARSCVTETDADDPRLPGRRSNLAAALASRFNHLGASADLDRAIDEFLAAAEGAAAGERSGYLSNLCGALMLRFLHNGDSASLAEAMRCGRRALTPADSADPRPPRVLRTAATALRTGFQRWGEQADIDDAVSYLRDAVRATPPGHQDEAGHLSALSTCLRVRFGATGDAHDIDGAVDAARTASEAASGNAGARMRYLSNLGAALSARHRSTGDPRDLRESAAVQLEATRIGDPDDPARATALANLGLTLRQGVGNDPSSREQAGWEQTCREQARWEQVRWEQAGWEQAHWEQTCREQARQAAEAYAASAAVEQAPASVRATSGYDAGVIMAELGDWPAALEHFRNSSRLLDAVADRGLDRDDRQYGLSHLSGLGSEAAAAALRAGAGPVAALELLERARGVLLAQALATRTDLAVLRMRKPNLADRFDNLSRALELMNDDTKDGDARLLHWKRKEYVRLLEEIRELPGFERFLQPDDEHLALRPPGPTIAINIARSGCDALIVIDGRVSHVALPLVTYQDTREQANNLLRAIGENDWTTNERVHAVLAWTWDMIMEPILDYLADQPGVLPTPETHVWWIPTGPLTVLPLHAAGRQEIPGASVLERVVSSYSPTLRALEHAAAGKTAGKTAGNTPAAGQGASVVVAVPNVPGHAELAAVETEAGNVAASLTALGSFPVTQLIGASAGSAEVIERLRTANWVHFACHGATLLNPADSYLALYDRALTVRELVTLRIDNAFLAYLSACTTAFGGTELVDEAIHISSAFQLAGFRQVIGTLWQVDDSVAELVARQTYASLLSVPPAVAVHRTVCELRSRYPANPRAWAAFVHVGA